MLGGAGRRGAREQKPLPFINIKSKRNHWFLIFRSYMHDIWFILLIIIGLLHCSCSVMYSVNTTVKLLQTTYPTSCSLWPCSLVRLTEANVCERLSPANHIVVHIHDGPKRIPDCLSDDLANVSHGDNEDLRINSLSVFLVGLPFRPVAICTFVLSSSSDKVQ